MKLSIYPKKEKSSISWMWRLLLGPASLLDGIFETLTFSFYGIGLRLYISKKLAISRSFHDQP